MEEKTFRELQIGAINQALLDAQVSPAEIDGIFTDGIVMPSLFAPEILEMAYGMGEVARVVESSRGILHALVSAFDAVEAGSVECALVYLGTNWGTASGGPYAVHDRYPLKNVLEKAYGFFGQPAYYSGMATRYAHDYNLSLEELEEGLGKFVVANRTNALTNEQAQLHEPLSLTEYLNSQPITYPLRRPDCSLITDGAAAIVVAREDRAKETTHVPIYLLGSGHGEQATTSASFFSQNPEYPRFPAAQMSSQRAYRDAGVAPEDVDLFEVYDCFSISVILQLEDMQIVPEGEGLAAIADMGTTVHGRLPVNTHGGLLAEGHIIGINHIVEAVRQLRGSRETGQVRDPETALVAMPPNRYHTTAILGIAGQ